MILGLDPGTHKTGWCIMTRPGRVLDSGYRDNAWVEEFIKTAPAYHLAIEKIVCQGRRIVGEETFTTCRWIGRFELTWEQRTGNRATLYSRAEAVGILGATGDRDVALRLRSTLGDCAEKETCKQRCRQKSCHLWQTNDHTRAAIAVANRFRVAIT